MNTDSTDAPFWLVCAATGYLSTGAHGAAIGILVAFGFEAIGRLLARMQ